jgi:lipoate-protein ligase A
MELRLLYDDAVAHSFGLAADQTIAQRTGENLSPLSLRLYTFRPCVLVGRFQAVEHELQIDYCRNHVIPINRRPTSGNAAVMGPEQLAVALMMPGSPHASYSQTQKLMIQFAQGVSDGLAELCLSADLQHNSSLSVGGRKIADLGLYRAASGGLLFHALIPVRSDAGHMLRVLHTPSNRISEKEIARMAALTTDIGSEVGWEISIDEVRRRIAKGCAGIFDAELRPGGFSPDERHAIDKLELKRYMDRHWIFQTGDLLDRLANAQLRTASGLLDVRVALAGNSIKSIWIGGDFFAAEDAIARLENSLRRHPNEPAAIAATLAQTYHGCEADLNGITLADLSTVIQQAIDNAVNRRWSGSYAHSLPGRGSI